MKVICIDASFRLENLPEHGECLKHLKEGEEYTVMGVSRCGGYFLKEVKAFYENEGFGWIVDRFVPLSSIDENEFERNYNQEKVLK